MTLPLTDEERAALTLPTLPQQSIDLGPLSAQLTLRLRVILGTITAPELTWESLRVGDHLPLTSYREELPIEAHTHRLGRGRVRRVGNHLAVQVTAWGSVPTIQEAAQEAIANDLG